MTQKMIYNGIDFADEKNISPSTRKKANEETKIHIEDVGNGLEVVRGILKDLGDKHDLSKNTPQEKIPLQAMYEIRKRFGEAPYQSEEYKKRTQFLRDAGMIEHHNKHNPHHPEHWKNGVSDMSLFYLLEMLCDWISASRRHGQKFGMEENFKSYGIDGMLANILKNTVEHPEMKKYIAKKWGEK